LHEGELVAWLVQAAARGQRFDAICSADTLCYFGPLEAFADAARRALVPGGSLVFTVEAHDDAPGSADHSLQPCGRYSHRRGYLDAVLRDAGFGPPLLTEVVLRREADRPVRGWLASARANG
jgi:predicted TPR repeat methyltransferase